MGGRVTTSEFGRGYATCLVQFVNHAPRLDEDEAIYAELRATSTREPTERPLFRPEDAAEIWANGAADHLIDLLHPRSGVTRADWAVASHVSDRSYRIGRTWQAGDEGTPDECRALLDDARTLLAKIGVSSWDEAFAWDSAHGLKPTEGYSATCMEPIPTRRGRS